MRKGTFYSSTGAGFESLRVDGRKVSVRTTPVDCIKLVGDAYKALRVHREDGGEVTEAEFEIGNDCKFAYVEIENRDGRKAWSNNLLPRAG